MIKQLTVELACLVGGGGWRPLSPLFKSYTYFVLIPTVLSEYPLLQPVWSNSNQVGIVLKFEQVLFKCTLSEVFALRSIYSSGEKQ